MAWSRDCDRRPPHTRQARRCARAGEAAASQMNEHARVAQLRESALARPERLVGASPPPRICTPAEVETGEGPSLPGVLNGGVQNQRRRGPDGRRLHPSSQGSQLQAGRSQVQALPPAFKVSWSKEARRSRAEAVGHTGPGPINRGRRCYMKRGSRLATDDQKTPSARAGSGGEGPPPLIPAPVAQLVEHRLSKSEVAAFKSRRVPLLVEHQSRPHSSVVEHPPCGGGKSGVRSPLGTSSSAEAARVGALQQRRAVTRLSTGCRFLPVA